MKKQKWIPFLKIFLCIVLISSASQIAYAAGGAYRDYTCPHTGTETAQQIGDACCWGCGTYGQGTRHIWDPEALKYYSPGTDINGSGYTTQTGQEMYNEEMCDFTKYYRCYNCFVTGRDTDLIRTVYKTSAGMVTVDGPYANALELNDSEGDVPTKWCANSTCGPAYAGLVDGSSKVYHFPADAKISITYNDTDGKQIKNSDSDKKAWNKSYSTTAPSEITYQGVKYVFSTSEVTSGGSPIVAEGSNQTVSFVITKAEYSVSFVYKPDKPKGVKVTGDAFASKNADETAVSGSYSVTVEGGKFDKVRVGWQEMGPNDSQGTVSYQSAGSNSDSCSGSLSKSSVKKNHSYQVVVEVTVGTDVEYFYSNTVSIGAPPPTPQVTVPLTPTPLPEPIEFPVMPPPEVVVPPLPVVNVIPKPAAPAAPPYVDTGHLYQCYTGEKHTHSGSQTSYGGCYTKYVRTDYYTCTYCGGIGLVGTCSGCWGSGIRDNEDRCSQCSGGTYTANCPSCSGGEVTCGTCNGSGKTGSTCGGTITSDASSHSLTRDPYYMTCQNSSCSGGQIKCSSCGGDGKVSGTCESTSFTKRLNQYKCDSCGASYSGLPTECGASIPNAKNCSSCGGEGSTECSRCEGDGYFTRWTCGACSIVVTTSDANSGNYTHKYNYSCSKCGASASGAGTCSKSTEKTCSECNGNKKVDCRQTINYNGDSKECSGGSASFSCGTCNGDGYVEGLCSYCAHHDGSGYSSTCSWGDGYYGDCDMSTTYYDVACGKTAGKYYSGSTECSPLCEKVITAYTPVYSDIKTTIIDVKDKGWTLEDYDSAYITVLASGHTSYKSPIELDGSYSALNTSLYNSAQNITLTAGGSGWYLNDAHAGTPKTVSMTMKVTIDSKVTVAFNAGYGTCSTKTKDYYYGSTYGSLPTPTAPTGYSFSGWYTGENGTGTKVTTGTSVVDYHNHSLYAYYTPNPAAGYTVTWDARPDGSPRGYFSGNQRYFTQSPIYYGQAITNPENSIIADTGYRFEGWRLNGTFYKKGTISGNYPWTNSTTFTAQYDAIESIVTFSANGGSVSETSRRVKYDQAYRFDAAANTLRAFPVPTRSGYAFDGWWTAASGGTEVKETDTVKITTNQTLYAHWKDTTTIVTYVVDNPGAVKSLSYSGYTYTYTVADGIKYVFPTVTLNEGYELAAADPWYYGSDAVTTGHELKTYDDHTITLKTRPKTMNVNFNSNGGAWPGGNGGVWTVSYGKEYGWYMAGGVAQRRTFPGTTKTGYTFLRWTQAENVKTPVTETTVVGKLTNHTLYAYWGNNKYTVTFNTNGADTCSTTVLSRVVAFGKPWTYVYSNQLVMDEANGVNAGYTEVPLPEVQKYGYHFDGWKLTDTSGNEIKDENGNPVFISTNKYNKYYNVTTAQDVIAVAVWTADTHTITIDKNDSDNVADKATIGTTTVTVSCDTSINTDIQKINLQRPGYKLLGLFTSDGVKVFDGNLFAVETTKNANGTYPSPSYWVYKSYVNNNASLLWNRHDNVTLYAHWTPINYYLDYADREWKNEYASNDGNVSYTEYKLAYNDVSHVVPGVDQFSATLMKYREIAYDFNDGDKTPNAAWLSYTSDRAHKFAVYEWTGYDVYKKSTGTLAYHRNLPYNVQAQEVEFPGRMTTVDNEHLYLFPTFGAVEYVTLPTATLRGYTFKGWTEVPNEGTVYGNVYQPKTDLPGKTTLYASWTPNPYTITLKPSKYGTVAKSAYTMIFDSTQNNNISSASPARTGYTFTGWYTAETGGTMVYKADGSYNPSCSYWNAEGEWVLDSDITLYAHWSANSYKLTFNPNAVSNSYSTVILNSTEQTVTYDSITGNVLEAGYKPSRTGYTFMGYFTVATAGNKVYDDTLSAYDSSGTSYFQTYWKNDSEFPAPDPGISPVWKYAGNPTLYAHWSAKRYTVILNDRGATSTEHTDMVSLTFDQKGTHIVTPTKTGYSFHGYFTGIRGTGTQYYDASGTCIKEWAEDNKTELFAYWIQDEVTFPEAGDGTGSEPLPEEVVEGKINGENSKALLYADDYNSSTGALTDLQPYLTYDTGETEGVIPGTEKISFRAKMGTWMFRYKLHKNTGADFVRFYVTVSYRTQYERSLDEELIISRQQTETYRVLVPKSWSYWEILQCGMYYPDKVIVSNDVMKNKTMEVAVNKSEEDESVSLDYEMQCYGEKTNHVFWEEYDPDGYPVLRLILPGEQYIISDVPDTLPDVNQYLNAVCMAAAIGDQRQAKVRNDRFLLDGTVILSDERKDDGNGVEINRETLDFYASSGEVAETSYLQTYKAGIALDETKPNGRYTTKAVITYIGDEKNINAPETLTVEISDINDLNIHTPVVCKGVVEEGMEQTEVGYELVLKEALNYFTLSVDNYGTHRMSFGYGTKDFFTALSGKSNITMQDGKCLNQVQFPFDVYVDTGNDYQRTDDILLAAGIWLTLDLTGQQFYVPVTLKNGEYPVKFRTIAVNCPRDEAGEYIISEVEQQANLSPDCYVAADVINLEIKSYLRNFIITSVNATTAAKQLKAGCQALTLKKGYGFSFELLTQGEFYGENANISIIPTFFWESVDGLVRKEVKLYHPGEFLKDVGRECTAWEGEPLLLNHENFDVIVQRFKGEAMVPADILCVDKDFSLEEYAKINTFTGKEEFFLREGYLIIRFNITVQSNEGVPYVFDRWESTKLAKDAKGQGWNYIPGDIIRYDLSKSIADDYEIGGSE